jgi:hypothetical protein
MGKRITISFLVRNVNNITSIARAYIAGFFTLYAIKNINVLKLTKKVTTLGNPLTKKNSLWVRIMNSITESKAGISSLNKE